MSLTGLAVRKSTTVLVLILFIFIAGLQSYFTLPREAAPDVKIPYMIVTTVYPGVSPADIENLVTRPIEQQLKTLAGVREITSSSSESFSMIAIEFEPSVDLDSALQQTKDKVDAARPDLPGDITKPTVTEINIENMPIINVVISADYDITRLKGIAENLQDAFETIPGVNEAQITGVRDREVQIYVDPNRLKDYNLSFFDVYNTVMMEHTNIPGGAMDIGDFTYSVRVPGEIRTPDGFKNLVVTASMNGPVYIRDVAAVTYGFQDPTTYSRLNGKPSVTISITKRAGENIVSIVARLKEIVEEQRPTFPRGTSVDYANDQSEFIINTVHELENNILTGFALVMLSIFLFLGLINSFFVAVCIPLSMLITFGVLSALGITLNMIVMFSLIMALGMLVDNAIVIVENIFRHRQMGMEPAEASVKATNQVAMAVSMSTLTTICAFAPLLFWPGMMGEFMKYLPLTLVITLLASLFVALVINPVLCSRFMKVKQGDIDKFSSGGGFFNKVLDSYGRVLNWALDNPKKTILMAFCTLILTFAMYAQFGLGTELFPMSDPDQCWIDVVGPVGMRLETTDHFAARLEEVARTIPDMETYITNVGVSTSSSGFGGSFDTSNEARIYLDFVDFDQRSQSSLKTYNEMFDRVNVITGAEVRVSMQEMGPPVGEAIAIQVSGEDFTRLGEIARDIRSQIRNIPGLVDLKDDFVNNKPEVVFRVDREKAAILGVSTTDVAMAVRTAINGFDAGDFRDGEDQYQITVRFPEYDRNALPDLNKIYVLHESRNIPLSGLGSFSPAAGMGTITRVDLKRVVTITGTNYGRLATDVLADVMATIEDYPLPDGYAIRYAGENEFTVEAQEFLSQALVIAVFLIMMVLVSQFDSVALPFIIITSAVLSVIGVLWGLVISGLPFGIIMTGVGVISLVGVVVNNSIVLLDYTLKLRKMGRTKRQAIFEGARTRFRPVILTAITTILGIIPLATGWSFNLQTMSFTIGGPSAQWWSPMAIAIIYGLAVATILTLVIVPTLYMILGRKEGDTYFEEHRTAPVS
ncbi:efflux RND transporter permease subunit [Candidatus Latescibacterota bacterium]